MNPAKRIQNRPLQVMQHIGFWALSFILFLLATSRGSEIKGQDVLYTFLFHVLLLPAVYINLNNFLYRLRIPYAWYIYSAKLLVLLVVSTYINYTFFKYLTGDVFRSLTPSRYLNWWETAATIFGYITITTLIKGTRSWFLLWRVRSELREAEEQKVQLELQALKSQINPHFLFNTLNGIYSMSLDNDKRLPETVLQLSELMRYFLYEAKDDFVPLIKELALLDHYISLQKIRLGESMAIDVNITGEAGEQVIAPMLLITFLENAFKHGNKTRLNQPFLRLHIRIGTGLLEFYIENEKGTVDDIEGKQYAGVGLANIQRRLALLYPGKHSLAINDEGNKYIVQLQLNLHGDQMHYHRG